MVQLRWSGLLYKGRGIFPQAPFGQTSPTSLIDLALFPYNRIIILSWCSVSWEGLKLYNIKNTNLVMLAKSQCMFWYSEELELLQKRKLRFDMMRAITTFQPLLHFYTGPRLGFSYQDEMRWWDKSMSDLKFTGVKKTSGNDQKSARLHLIVADQRTSLSWEKRYCLAWGKSPATKLDDFLEIPNGLWPPPLIIWKLYCKLFIMDMVAYMQGGMWAG